MDYIAKATEVLHQFKLKATRPRVAILAYLMTHHNHPTVEVIAQQLHGDGKKLATIYNTLKLLEQHGVVIELRNGDHSTHYDYFSHPHFHIICAKCGKIADVEYPNADRVETQMLAEAKNKLAIFRNGHMLRFMVYVQFVKESKLHMILLRNSNKKATSNRSRFFISN